MLSDLVNEIKELIVDITKSLFLKLKYVLAFFLILSAVLGILFLKQKNPEQIETQELFLAGISISNWATWISMIAIPITAIWAMYQYKKNIKIRQQEKATDIAKEFSKTIVDELDILNNVYLAAEWTFPKEEKMVNKIRYFNTNEIRLIFEDDNFPTLYKQLRNKSKKMLNYLYHLELYKRVAYCDIREADEITDRIKKNKINDEDKEKLELYFKTRNDMPYHFWKLESQALNKLEYLCMEISSRAADSNYIYQSLHQMFLRSVRILYLEISALNTKYADKYYTNIIHVYNLWQKKYIKQRDAEQKKIMKANEQLNPKIETI